MVTEEEIRLVSKLMKIETGDYKEYVDKVHAMIDYFDILDSAGVESEEIDVLETQLSGLRQDEHVPHDGRLIDALHSYRDRYIRAPRMS